MNSTQIRRVYFNHRNNRQFIACELANAAGILAGIGAIPFLIDRLASRFWIAQGMIAILLIVVGLFFLERGSPHLLPLFKRLLAFLRGHLPLPKRQKPAPGPLPLEIPAVLEKLSAVTDTPPQVSRLVLLPYLTLAIGLFILLPALLVAILERFVKTLDLPGLEAVSIYFSFPALLICVIGEIPYISQRIAVKPWKAFIITGVLKSGLKALSAMLVFVYIALTLGGEEHTRLLYGGLGLALAGLVFGFISARLEQQRLPAPAAASRPEPGTTG